MSALSEEDRANLVAYLDGELDEEATQALEARLSQDEAARAELETLKQVYGLLDYLPRPEPSSSFTNRTMERLAIAQAPRETGTMPGIPGRRWLAPLGWAVALALIFGLGWLAAGWYFKEPVKEGPPGPADTDDVLVRHLRLLEKYPQYQHLDDVDFLRALDHADLFGEEGGT